MKKYALIFCCLNLPGKAQQLNLKTYAIEDGIGHSQVSQIIQDDKGYLWFSLFGGGISRFDGKNFLNYSEKHGLCSNLTRPIIKDHKGIIWIGSLGGKTCIYDGKISKPFVSAGDTLPDKVYSILEDEKHNIWFGTESGVFIFDGKKTYHLNGKNDPPAVPVMHIYQDKNKNIWIAPWERGIYKFDGKNFEPFTMADGLSYHTAMGFSEDNSGNIWVSTFKGVTEITTKKGLYKLNKFNHPILDSSLIFKVTDDNKSTLYFATADKGILTYDYHTHRFSSITTKNGLPGNVIYNIFKDHEDNLWISCWGYGLTRFSGNRFIRYTVQDGLPNNAVQCFTETKEGNLIFGTGTGLSLLNNSSPEKYLTQIDNETVYSIVQSNNDVLWISTSKAVYRIKSNIIKKFTSKDGLHAFPATAMAVDKNNNIWFGSWSGGVTKFDGNNFVNFDRQSGISSLYIYSIYPDTKGNVWFCTWDGGLCKLNGNDFSFYTVKNGLPNNNVIAAREDKDGNLWLGTYGGGIARFDGKGFKIISSANGLSDDACNGIAIDKNNSLWVTTSKGIDKINIDEFNKSGKTDFRHYGAAEGFNAGECLRNAIFEDTKGNIWLGTKAGAYCFQPQEDLINLKEPITHITGIKLFFETSDFTQFSNGTDSKTGLPDNLCLPYGYNHLTFSYVGLSYTAPENTKYKIQLQGVDKNWSPETDKTEATYSGLQPGKYIFKVVACNSEGVWNKKETSFEFEILPPWYKTWWAYAGYVFIAISGYLCMVHLRTRKLQSENEKLEQVVNERTQEIVQQKNLVEEKNKEITDSIQYAKRIQSTLLAHNEFLKQHLAQHFVLFKPKDIVSGDFYWATSAGAGETGKFYFAVCDSTGHGVPGAFMSLLNISFLNEAINEKKIELPGEVFNYVRSRLIANVSQEGARDGMDGILVMINKAELKYAAAHNKPVLIRNGAMMEMQADKMPVGQGEKTESFKTYTVQMQKGDCLYLYTDGFADQFGGAKGKKYKYKQLNEILIKIHQKSTEEQSAILENEFENWRGNLEQVDDVCIIGIRF